MSDQQEATVVVPEVPGSQPLRNARHEIYARRLSVLMPKIEAYRAAGFASVSDHATQGNAAKLERNPKIRARVAFLCRQPEEILAAKRAHLEAKLWCIHEADERDLFETYRTEKRDRDGEVIRGKNGKPVMVTRQRAKLLRDIPDDTRRAIEEIRVTEDGRMIPKRYSAMQANIELRKLLGIGNQPRDGGDEISGMATGEIISELQKMGVDVRLSLEWNAGHSGRSDGAQKSAVE